MPRDWPHPDFPEPPPSRRSEAFYWLCVVAVGVLTVAGVLLGLA